MSAETRGRSMQAVLRQALVLGFSLWTIQTGWAQQSPPARETHPLMPGIRSRDILNPDWPRSLHDELATGFSPLVCGMKTTPIVCSTIDVGGTASWLRVLKDEHGRDRLLVEDGRLRLMDPAGKVLWTSSTAGNLVLCGDNLLLCAGPRLTLVDAQTGTTQWTHTFDPPHVQARAAVADLIPAQPGLEAAVFLEYGETGCVINFPPQGEPQFVWQRTVVIPGEHPERFDHGCDIQLDLSKPDQAVIWNVRRFRCRGFDARTGEMISSLAYEIGGEKRRNYGPWALGKGKGGRPLICVVGEQVQTHVHAIRLNRDGPNELAWEHYYGEVYKEAVGVAVKSLAIADLDGDGETEMAYTVRDPARQLRSFVRVRDADTGEVEFELPDTWGIAPFFNLGSAGANGLIVCAAPGGGTPSEGDLEFYRFRASAPPQLMATLRQARLWGSAIPTLTQGSQLLVREVDQDGHAVLARFGFNNDKLKPVDRTRAAALVASPVQTVMQLPDGSQAFVVTDRQGTLQAWSWSGSLLWELPLRGGEPAALSAADLDGDRRAELVAITPGDRVRVFSVDTAGEAHKRGNYQYLGRFQVHCPLLHDLDGDGRMELIAPGSTRHGKLVLRAIRGEGSLLWETPLDQSADDVNIVTNAGQFLPGGRSAVAVSLHASSRTVEGTFLLDGPSGKILWFKDRYRDGATVMPYRAQGVPTAFDFDGDGAQDIGMDMLSYMAFLRGVDGSFAYLRHTRNLRLEGAVYAGVLYNTYCPIYKQPTDEKPHWMVTVGFGSFGLMKPDPREGIWREDLGYDAPPHIGMVDVDGDGSMEVGYAAGNSSTFVCRDLWTGAVEFQLELPSAPNSPALTADVDGDGKGEFLIGPYCIGTNAQAKGELRWQSPVPLGWAAIADFDGDGQGEIACAAPGKIVILKAQQD